MRLYCRFFLSRLILVAAILGAFYATQGEEAPEALITFHASSAAAERTPPPYMSSGTSSAEAGQCREFIVDADGSVVLFGSQVFRWIDGKWSEDAGIRPEGAVCDAVRAPDGTWFIVSRRLSQDALLYRYDGSRLSQIAAVQGRFQECITLHLAPDGTVWIASKGPILYGVKEGKTMTHELLPGASTQAFFPGFPPVASFTMPDGGLWIWPHGDYRANRAMESAALKGFHVYNDGQWRTVPHSGGVLGGAVPVDLNTILFATRYKGIFSLSAVDGTAKAVDWTLPGKEACVFLHAIPSGRVLAITAEPVMQSQLARNEDGALGKLVVFENGKARVLLDGVDFGEGRFDKGRPVADTPQGTFIATAGGGVVFVNADASQARRLDWRFNVPTANVDRMRVQGSRLYLLDRFRGLAIMDWAKLLTQSESPEKDRWKTYGTLAEPAAAPDGAIWWLDAGNAPGRLSCWKDGLLMHLSLEDGRLTPSAVQFLAADTKGGIWLIPQQVSQTVACFRDGKWRTFGGWDAAWSAAALEAKDDAGFNISCGYRFCPAFGGNGHAAYRDPASRRIRYFNGIMWTTTTDYPPNDRGNSDGPPTFVNGVLTAPLPTGDYQYIEWQWKPQPGKIARNDASLPFPGDAHKLTISRQDTTGLSWAGNPDELYRGIEDLRVRFLTKGTPLFAAERLSNVLVDASGDLWFVIRNASTLQLAHYSSRNGIPALEWAEPPQSIIVRSKAVFSCRIQRTEGQVIVRFRSDGGAWQQIPSASAEQTIVFENLPNGKHTVEVRAYDELLRSSKPLTWMFEVQRDYSAEVRELLLLLESRDYSQRESAARALVSVGRTALPELTARKEKASESVRWWLQAILDEISRNE